VGGYVRNCSDGSVEAVFEGHEGTVEALVAWCREGPAWAQVSGVELSEEEPSGARSFVVR
jgi:acylphosphatase